MELEKKPLVLLSLGWRGRWVQGLRFLDCGLGFRVQGLGFRVWGLGPLGFRVSLEVKGSESAQLQCPPIRGSIKPRSLGTQDSNRG